MQTTQSEVRSLSVPQEHIRNVCILAHVDHGKTTCADNLICSNNIISRQSAGRIRYMDSRLDEQERQITMKSSSIALRWTDPLGQGSTPSYLINLIDSPGHVDFTSEVSSAARLADGALIVVDVVEGVEAQTRTVLRQAWRDRVKTCLLLNKVDRLVTELELSPLEAYGRIVKILEEINMANAQLVSEDAMAKVAAEATDAGPSDLDLTAGLIEIDDEVEEAWRYSPERGNVAFGSAYHGWAFRIDTFARIIGGKMGANPKNFQKVLWGNWAFNKKTKHAQRRSADDTKTKPMFVEFILGPLFAAYGACFKTLDDELLGKMKSQVPAWKDVDLSRLTAGSSAVRELMSRWLPFAECILQMSTEHMPSPITSVASRLPVLCPRWFAGGVNSVITTEHRTDIADGLRSSSRDGPTVGYLTKFLAADIERSVLTDDSVVGDGETQFVGLCRVFSGCMRQEQTLFVQKEDGDKAQSRVMKVKRLFQLMGRFMQEVTEAPSGSIVAIAVVPVDETGNEREDVELGVERCLTFCDSADGPNFETPYSSQAFAIVRVSIEPRNVADLDALDRGLRLLHKADPSVSVQAMVTGENVLGCCGDEHLKRCLSDLQRVYARDIPLSISNPLVAVRESLTKSVDAERLDKKDTLHLPIWASHIIDASTEASSTFTQGSEQDQESDAGGTQTQKVQERVSMNSAGVMSVWTANRKACLRVSATVLPPNALEWMDAHAEELESVVHRQRPSVAFAGEGEKITLGECLIAISEQFDQKMRSEEGVACPGVLCGLSVAKGSRAVLIDATSADWTLSQSCEGTAEAASEQEAPAAAETSLQVVPMWLRPAVLSGFQMAANAGPLCEEPMRGIAFVLHACQVVAEDTPVVADGYPAALSASAQPYGPMSGQMMVAMKEACRYCLFRRGFARISEVMLALEVTCEMEMLGKVHGVLGKRRCKVMDEGLREGTSMFYISAFLPLADSFGLSNDLRFAASGNVAFHCAFSHWELSDDDPFQEASLTADEVEELGDQPLPANKARRLIDGIRKRKGLPTDEKVVKFGSQQSTLTKMK